jgi:hypothetical protein
MTDLTAYHPLFNLSLTRSYNSYDFAQDGAFGPGWSSDFPLDYTVGFDATSNSRLVDLSNADPATRVLVIEAAVILPWYLYKQLAIRGGADLSEIAAEQIYLGLPLKPVCKNDCRGLCPVCGVNRNLEECACVGEEIDPRLAPLLAFKRRNPPKAS